MVRAIALLVPVSLMAVVGAWADEAEAPSFNNDVIPVLTRLGCNAGGCHGKLAGQNGFRLSLRGYAPELDHKWLTREFATRRIDTVEPERSLLLRKAVGDLAHGGGQLTQPDSRAYQVLVDWIAAGAPGPQSEEPAVERIEVAPQAVAVRPGASQSLEVTAVYDDGSRRPVTWLAQFESNDPSLATVDEHGTASLVRSGETAVRVSFAGHVEAVLLSAPYEHDLADKPMPEPQGFIDQHVFAKLQALRIPASRRTTDDEFVRRVFLDTIGTLPTPEEVDAFLADTADDKRARLIDALLARDEFVDHWTMLLGDLFQNRRERDHDVRGDGCVERFHTWLRERVANNTKWPDLAREVLTAEGANTENPAVGYFIVGLGTKRNPAESDMADNVAQSFLGTRIGCARCHNHPLERFTQDDYYHFVAFFSRVSLDRQKPDDGPTTLALMPPSAGQTLQRIGKLEEQLAEAREKDDEPEIERKQKELERAREQFEHQKQEPAQVRQPRTGAQLPPRPLDRAELPEAPNGDPRVLLVDWMTAPDNNEFWGAIVNRVWKHYLAVGLVEPVDDLRATNPPSHPELWRELINDFQASGGDLRHLMRRILNSQTYQLASTTLPENTTDERFYSHYYVRRLPAEVLMDAIAAATGVPDSFPEREGPLRAIQLPGPIVKNDFLHTFGRSPRVTACACERSGEVTLPQLLNLQNGDNVLEKIASPEGRLHGLLKQHSEPEPIVEALFLATQSRRPSPTQKQAALSLVSEAPSLQEGLEDLFWALINSKEFSFNH